MAMSTPASTSCARAGGRVRTGGITPDRAGYFYPPTVRTDVANGTEYGLVSYVYTGDLARGLRVAEALDAGTTASWGSSKPGTSPHVVTSEHCTVELAIGMM